MPVTELRPCDHGHKKNPALANNWDDSVGTINAGLYADLVVLDTFHQDPYRNLIEAIDADVRLTVVNGQPVFGDVDIMSELKGDDWELVGDLVSTRQWMLPIVCYRGNTIMVTSSQIWKWPWRQS